jgi:hypothetical protein
VLSPPSTKTIRFLCAIPSSQSFNDRLSPESSRYVPPGYLEVQHQPVKYRTPVQLPMAPAYVLRLPPELLDHILSYLFKQDSTHGIRPSIPDLLSISRTSGRLRLHALPFIYRDIRLSDRSSQWGMKLLLRTLLSQPGLLEHIRTVCLDTENPDWRKDWPWPGSQLFTPHDSYLLASFMRGIGMEPNAFIEEYFESLRHQPSEELKIPEDTVLTAAKFNTGSSPVSVALIVALLLTCPSSKLLDLRLVVNEGVYGLGEFWEILKQLMQSEGAGSLHHVQKLSYVGYREEHSLRGLGGWEPSDRPDQRLSPARRNQHALLFGIPMESISLSTSGWGSGSLVHELTHGDFEYALTSMTLSTCGTAPLVATLRVCPHLKTLNYSCVIKDDSFDAEALGIALGHVRSLEHVKICVDFTWEARQRRPGQARWLHGNIGTLKNLVKLRTLEIPTQVLLGWDLDTPVPRLPLCDVFPASLQELTLRDDGAKLSCPIGSYSYFWAKTLSPLSEYLDWRGGSGGPSMGAALYRVGIVQRNHLLDSAVAEKLQQKCYHLGITFSVSSLPSTVPTY